MDKKLLRVGFGLIALILLSTFGVIWFGKTAQFRGTSYEAPYPPAPSIELTRADGVQFRLSDQRGKIVLVFFGYTHCPDVCPTTMAQLKLVMEELGDRSNEVNVVLITVDPDRDTPQVIQEYAEHFDADFIGLSGSTQELSGLWTAYGVSRMISSSEDSSMYMVDHTARITLIDAEGNLRLSYGFQTPYQDIVHDINILLK